MPEVIEQKVDAINTQIAQLYESRKQVVDTIQTKRFALVQASPELKKKSERAQAARVEMAALLDKDPEVVAAMEEVSKVQENWQKVEQELKTLLTERTPGKVSACPLCGTSQEIAHFEQHIRTARADVAKQRRAMAEARVKVMQANPQIVALRKEADSLTKQVVDAQMSNEEIHNLAIREQQVLNEITGLVSNRAAVLRQAAAAESAAGKTSS